MILPHVLNMNMTNNNSKYFIVGNFLDEFIRPVVFIPRAYEIKLRNLFRIFNLLIVICISVFRFNLFFNNIIQY